MQLPSEVRFCWRENFNVERGIDSKGGDGVINEFRAEEDELLNIRKYGISKEY